MLTLLISSSGAAKASYSLTCYVDQTHLYSAAARLFLEAAHQPQPKWHENIRSHREASQQEQSDE